MTKDEVIEAFSKGLVVKDRESGKVGEILVIDRTDSTARIKGADGWRQWSALEVADPKAIAELEAKAEKVKAALNGLLLKAPRIRLSANALEKVREDRRCLDMRLIGIFANGSMLTVTLNADGSLAGYGSEGSLGDIDAIED